MIENVIIKNKHYDERIHHILFGDEYVHFTGQTTIEGLVVELGLYKSLTQARKRNRTGDIEFGWTPMFKATKKCRLWIWNPVETVE